jgi:hypothetical protein
MTAYHSYLITNLDLQLLNLEVATLRLSINVNYGLKLYLMAGGCWQPLIRALPI